jgi:outer membrane protein OmpA-like peptidoglycan-associated protein
MTKLFNARKLLILLPLLLLAGVLFAIGLSGERYAISGIEYYDRGDYDNAIREFMAADKAANGEVPQYHFWLARLYIAKTDTLSATTWIHRYLQSSDNQYRQEAHDYLKILSRQHHIFENVNIRSLPTYLHSRNSDYGAVVSPDGKHLYYTSLSPAKTDKENIWRSERLATGWGRPYLVEELNTDKNEALGSFSKDGMIAYLFGNYARGQLDGDIYQSLWTGDKWGEPQAISAVNSPALEAHPFVYNDELMFFTSSRDGGFGGTDIWVSEFVSGGWSQPINLGSMINSSGNEQTPFLAPDGRTLFFASNNYPGFGGYDIYKSVRLGDGLQEWSVPENLGLPANSIRNDRAFVHIRGSNEAIISTDRSAEGFEKMATLSLVYTVPPSYVVIDEDTKEEVVVYITPEGDMTEAEIAEADLPVEETKPLYATISGMLMDQDGKPVSAEIEFTTHINGGIYRDVAFADEDGNYAISLPVSERYTVIVNEEAYMLFTEEIPFNSGEDTEYNITLQELEPEKVFAFQNILFEFESAVLKKESYAVLDEIVLTMLNNNWLKLDIAGYTCNMGSERYNLKLSKERANSVYEYLLEKGVEKERLNHTGYGEANPLNDNATIAKRQQNRRVEFTVKK